MGFKNMVLIKTRVQSKDYDQGYVEAFGRRCFHCREHLDNQNAVEWERQAHEKCEQAHNSYWSTEV